MKIQLENADAIVDYILIFISSELRLSPKTTIPVFREIFRLFINSWIRRGKPLEKIRDSKSFWFNVDGFRKKSDFRCFLKWIFTFLKLSLALLQRKVLSVGARDKKWTQQFYKKAAYCIDFGGHPSLIINRSESLRFGLKKHLLKQGLLPTESEALSYSLPENLLEGCLFQINIFLNLISAESHGEICSEDLVENLSSACLVAATLHRGWKFTYKEHALPMLIFQRHFSEELARIASRVILTEDYSEFISDPVIQKKSVFSAKKRGCRFKFDPNGSRVLCFPFISGTAEGSHWTGEAEYVRDLRYSTHDREQLLEVFSTLNRQEKTLVKYHPLRSRAVSLAGFPAETYDGSGVREVFFVGWTQGLFECRQAGIPARLILTRPLHSLTDAGRSYIRQLENRGELLFMLQN
jgi:hypothetical protein